MWNAAGTAGLVLGSISTIYLFASQLIAGNLAPASFWQSALAIILWFVKLISCIWFLYFFMKRYAQANEGIDQKSIFRMGRATALLSALMFSAIYLANMLYISADFYEQVFQTAINQMTPTLDSNAMNAMEKVMGMLPQITFSYYLIYCFIFGTVLAAILSRYISSKEQLTDEQQIF